MKALLAVVLLATIAQIPSCQPGQADTVVGYVEDKYTLSAREGSGPAVPYILVNGREYKVPWNFFVQVNVGDIVKFENGRWTIVKKYTP